MQAHAVCVPPSPDWADCFLLHIFLLHFSASDLLVIGCSQPGSSEALAPGLDVIV